jgi:hypothetical protein
MPLETFLKRVFNESTDTDDEFAAVAEIYENDDEPCDDEWNDAVHSKMEAATKVHVVRNGNITAIARSTRPGYKIAHGEEQKMSFAERRARERAADRTYERRKRHQSDRQQAKRISSIEKRKTFGLDRVEEE